MNVCFPEVNNKFGSAGKSDEELERKGNDAGDGGVVGVAGDEFGLMVDGDGGDDEIQRAGVETLVAAALTEAGGIPPELRWGGQERQGGELGFDLGALGCGGMAKDLESDGFANAGIRIEDPWLDDEFPRRGCFGPGEVDPEGGFDQSRH